MIHVSSASASDDHALWSRRLWPLTVAQACGAVNDNLVKNAMLVMALFRLQLGGAGLSALAGALFIIPYVLLSATAGTLADRYSKPRLTVIYKLAECVLMAFAGIAFLTASVPALLTVLFGLGCQAALFGPVKYGVLPEYLSERELLAGNGITEAATFLAIVAGTLAGGALMTLPSGPAIVAATGMLLALLGLWAAVRMPPLPAAEPGAPPTINILASTVSILHAGMSRSGLAAPILCISWFWAIGATVLTELPVATRDNLHAQPGVLTALLTVFAVGVGLGSLGCSRLLGHRPSARLASVTALGISLFLWDFSRGVTGALPDVHALLTTLPGWRLLADMTLLAVCGGMFSVPFYTLIQTRSAAGQRSRMIACNNIMNAVFMAAGAGATAGLAATGLDAMQVLALSAAANLLVALWLFWVRPDGR